MNTLRHIAPFWFVLLLLVLPAPASLLAQVSPLPSTALPEGIEATGDTVEVRALTDWAEEQLGRHPEQAERVTQRALALARNLDDQPGIGKSLLILGNLATDLDQQEAYYTEAQEAFEQIGDEGGVLRSRQNRGLVYEKRGDLEQALTIFFDVLEGFERLGDAKSQAIVLNNIANIHSDQNNLEEALTYYEQAIVLAETLNKPDLLVFILNNHGLALSKQDAFEIAEAVYRRALAISEEEGLPYYSVAIYTNLGALFNEQGRHEYSLSFLLPAERLSQELGEDVYRFVVNDELGKTFMGLGEYDRALQYALENLTLAQQEELATGSIVLNPQMMAHETLSQIYEAAGNYEQSLIHYRQYAAAKDSVFNAEKTGIITEMQTRYETEEKQRAIERFEQENRIQALQRTFLLAGVGGLLLLLAILFSRYRLEQRTNRLLEELDVAKSRFFANISHEFRTPLTVVLGSMQDALAGRFGKTTKTLTVQHQAVLRNTRRLQGLIDEVLDLNRLEAGKLELNPVPGDLIRSLRRIVEADAPLAERNGINLMFEPDVESCPRLYDQEKLEKVVGNLLSNALKFTPRDGSVRVNLNCEEKIEIVVSDDGPGIQEEAHEKVFERFAQVEDGAFHGGTGIGLALARELAELHGGTITLESEFGEGSTFTVRLPLEEVSLEAVLKGNDAAVSESLPAEAIAISSDGLPENPIVANDEEGESDRTTVLVIEDNDDIRAYVRRSLEKTYRVLEVPDGDAGLQKSRSELPDLIVSDVMLPGIDGYEVARRLKAEPATECIPVVMLTARAAEEDQTVGYGSGAEAYLTKPFSPETLRAAIARLLDERRRLRKRLRVDLEQSGEETSQNGHPTLADRARTAILENLHDETFGVKELASALGMTRRTLYRKLSPEVGLSPSDFVRTHRLERARQLLTTGAGSVSEVAYAVGFKSISHFTRSFREHYGKPPSSVFETRKT